jgi:hypothetical protein
MSFAGEIVRAKIRHGKATRHRNTGLRKGQM